MAEEIKKVLRLDKKVYYRTHLSILNSIFGASLSTENMTPMEIKVLSEFMCLTGDLTAYRFGPTARKVVMQQLSLSPAGLSNYTGSLLDKGFLIKTGDIISILPLLIPEEKEQLYKFKLINNETIATT
jgi:hypothetical protein